MIWKLGMGIESKMWNILYLKDLVFVARDIENDLIIKQYSSYILMINIKWRGYIYTIVAYSQMWSLHTEIT